jgi:cytochrome aa3-600 menaquinol oxidase subunit 2
MSQLQKNFITNSEQWEEEANMTKKSLLISILALIPVFILSGCSYNMAVFNPKGPAAREILGLINWSLVFMAIITIVIFGLFGFIVW